MLVHSPPHPDYLHKSPPSADEPLGQIIRVFTKMSYTARHLCLCLLALFPAEPLRLLQSAIWGMTHAADTSSPPTEGQGGCAAPLLRPVRYIVSRAFGDVLSVMATGVCWD